MLSAEIVLIKGLEENLWRGMVGLASFKSAGVFIPVSKSTKMIKVNQETRTVCSVADAADCKGIFKGNRMNNIVFDMLLQQLKEWNIRTASQFRNSCVARTILAQSSALKFQGKSFL